ncbi:uncharacterized protein V1516DRAFT_167304 [Lipomyces oligophaga]|uniref:uncharacterized protein n=1 Tax=Lipomyces oligophaga TaxID=45792 RepID=UPI0034CEE586
MSWSPDSLAARSASISSGSTSHGAGSAGTADDADDDPDVLPMESNVWATDDSSSSLDLGGGADGGSVLGKPFDPKSSMPLAQTFESTEIPGERKTDHREPNIKHDSTHSSTKELPAISTELESNHKQSPQISSPPSPSDPFSHSPSASRRASIKSPLSERKISNQHVRRISNNPPEIGEVERILFPAHAAAAEAAAAAAGLPHSASNHAGNPVSPSSPKSPQNQYSEFSYQNLAAPGLALPPTTEEHSSIESIAAESATDDPSSSSAKCPIAEDPNTPSIANEDDGWQDMPVFASHDIYDDEGNIIAHEEIPSDPEAEDVQRGGASKGYTRVTLDAEDADRESVLDDETKYLFNDEDPTDANARNPLAQLQTTKQLLTDTQRIAYVGLCKLCMVDMATEIALKKGSPKIARPLSTIFGSMAMWSQKISIRLYAHMELSSEEQIMIEQLSSHGIEASDLSPCLLQNARILNPINQEGDMIRKSIDSDEPLPEYTEQVPDHVLNPTELEDDETLDIDIRWTVLCDLFLVLVADSVYDARSRTLLERVGKQLNVSWLDITKFEKRVTDALDVEERNDQVWKEDEILETRRKRALKKKYVYMGLATIGGGLVIGLSAGLLAPVIGAGLAAGFTTIGIAGTSGFLAGAGGAAIVTTTGAAIGAKVGASSMARRMGHVKTFEFRPLHNNERVNLIITVSGWMSGKMDDVRLPFSTVDPIMGDLFSLYWEPDMLTSMGQTINLLATEVLTQSIQQVLGSTVLVALMSSLQLPMILSKLSYLLDNPWSVSLDRAWSAGLILADTLIRRNLGVRPITLVGFSLGARVIISCLNELAKRDAVGIVQNVYLFGSPVVVKRDMMVMCSSMVSGRFVNGFSRKDWVLGYLFRATSGGLGRIAGLAPIENIAGIENLDCTDLVDGHMAYREAMPRLLSICGWEVVSEEFSEIEDPDPDLERERQRELIVEFEEARRQMEQEAAALQKQHRQKQPGLFGKWLKPKKKEWWDMYEEAEQEQRRRDAESGSASSSATSTVARNQWDPTTFRPGEYHYQYQPKQDDDGSSDVLFDVEAIRKEIRRAQARGL